MKRLADEEIAVTRIAEPVMRVNENLVDVNYTVFIEVKATGQTEQVRETHRMRYLFLPELMLQRQGLFDERATHAWMSQGAGDGSRYSSGEKRPACVLGSWPLRVAGVGGGTRGR